MTIGDKQDFLEGFIERLEQMLNAGDPNLHLHWSDVEFLKLLQDELRELHETKRGLQLALSKSLAEILSQ